jgi:hypothetical protein
MKAKLSFLSGSLSGGFSSLEEKHTAGIAHDGLLHRFETAIRYEEYGQYTAPSQEGTDACRKAARDYADYLLRWSKPGKDLSKLKSFIKPSWLKQDDGLENIVTEFFGNFVE